MTRELTQRSFQLTHDDLKARKGEDSCSRPASVEIRTRSPAPGFTWSCRHSALCDWWWWWEVGTGCRPLLMSFLYAHRASSALHRHVGGLQVGL